MAQEPDLLISAGFSAAQVAKEADKLVALYRQRGEEAGKAFKDATGKVTDAEGLRAHMRELDNLAKKYDPVYRATKQYEAEVKRLDQALKVGAVTQAQYSQRLQEAQVKLTQTGKATADVAAKTGGGMRGNIQNLSFQLQDFAVQVAAGTSASTALGQQLPQLLGGFGALGAVLGAVVAVGVPLAAMFLKSGEDAEGLRKQIEALDKALSSYNDAIDNALAPMDELWKRFGTGAEAARETYKAMLEIERIEYLQGMKASITAVSEQLGGLTDALERYQGSLNSSDGLGEAKAIAVQSAINELNKYFGLTIEQAERVNQALQNMAAARDQGPAAAAQAARELGDALMQAYEEGGRTNDALLAAAKEAYNLQLNAAEAATVMGDVADGAGAAADGTLSAADAAEQARAATENWAAAMSGVRAEIGAIASALSSMGGGMISNASKFVELNALKQGKTVAEAAQARQRAQMEADFAAREMAAGTWVEKMILKGEKVLAERGMALDGELDAARAEARKAEQAAVKAASGGSGRKKSGGGRSGGAAKEPVDIFETAEREIQQLERQIALLGKSSEETARLQAQWAMLDAAKKAGIPINDQLNAQIAAQAEQVGNLTAQLEQAELAQEQFDQAIEGIANAFSNAILEGENLRDSLAQIFRQIAANILNAGIQQALTSTFSGMGGGGFWGSLASAAFGGTKAAVPSFDGGGFTGIASRSGGIDGKGGFPAILHPNETVLDHTRGQRVGSFAPVTNITISGNADQQTLAQLRRELDMRDRRLAQQVPSIMDNHQKRRG